jgi:hypothetical protein
MPKPSVEATYERACRLANVAMWSIDLQCRRLRTSEPEDEKFILRKWADFDFLIVSLWRLRRAAELAAGVHQLKRSLRAAIRRFDTALPELKKLRDVAEHIDDYALDRGHRKKTVARESLEVSRIDDHGPTLDWLGASLDAFDAFRASQSLFAAIKDGSRAFQQTGP